MEPRRSPTTELRPNFCDVDSRRRTLFLAVFTRESHSSRRCKGSVIALAFVRRTGSSLKASKALRNLLTILVHVLRLYVRQCLISSSKALTDDSLGRE